MLHVIAEIEVNEGMRDAFLKEFRRIVPIVRDEDGCIEYGPTVDRISAVPFQPAARPNLVTVIEKWSSEATLKAHLDAPHMAEYLRRVEHMRKSVTIYVLDPA